MISAELHTLSGVSADHTVLNTKWLNSNNQIKGAWVCRYWDTEIPVGFPVRSNSFCQKHSKPLLCGHGRQSDRRAQTHHLQVGVIAVGGIMQPRSLRSREGSRQPTEHTKGKKNHPQKQRDKHPFSKLWASALWTSALNKRKARRAPLCS